MAREFVLIGTPGSPGIGRFQDALGSHGHRAAQVISYDEIVDHGIERHDLTGKTVRIDSPGRSERVYAKMLALGADALAQRGVTPCADAAGYQAGEIINPRQWYLGFCRVLSMIGEHAARQGARLLSDPADIATMFCKTSTHALLRKAGIPVPRSLGSPVDYEELRRRMRENGKSRVFIKLNHGSAASGLMALAVSDKRIQAHSTVEAALVRGRIRLFNTRKIKCYRSEAEIAAIMDQLCGYGAHVEEWIPKIGIKGHTCDMRVLVINRRPSHFVLRLAKSPFTNLHLKNQRAEAGLLAERVGHQAWQAIHDTCESCAALFPRTLHVGLDLAVSTSKNKHFVLEVNAFGDQLNGVSHNDLTTHEAEVAALDTWLG